MGVYAKVVGKGRTKFYDSLRSQKILMQNSTLPYQSYVQLGYFKCKMTSKNQKSFSVTFLTGKGIDWITKKLKLEITEDQQKELISQTLS